MSNNAPPFDPLNATREEEDAMFEGYRCGSAGGTPPALPSVAFEHGYRMARNDLNGVVDTDQGELARRYAELQRAGRA